MRSVLADIPAAYYSKEETFARLHSIRQISFPQRILMK